MESNWRATAIELGIAGARYIFPGTDAQTVRFAAYVPALDAIISNVIAFGFGPPRVTFVDTGFIRPRLLYDGSNPPLLGERFPYGYDVTPD